MVAELLGIRVDTVLWTSAEAHASKVAAFNLLENLSKDDGNGDARK